jgi:hypothetical protein
MAGGTQELKPSPDRALAIVGAGEAREIDANHLVAHHLVHHRITLDELGHRDLEEALHQRGEFGRAHARGKLCRPRTSA